MDDAFWETDELPGRWLHQQGRRYLYCSGTGYLGMARNPAFAALLTEGLARYGTNYGSSRNSNLRLRIYAEAEEQLACRTGAAAALTVSSGYLAGQMAVKALADAGRFEYAPDTHPAAWLTAAPTSAPVAFSHAAWAAELLARLAAEAPVPVVVVCNSLDPLRVCAYDFSWVSLLPTNRPITLLVDDSHGFGVTGEAGSGVYAQLRVPPTVRLVVVASLGKACGVPGGLVLSSDVGFIAALRRSAFFAASSPIVPAYLYAFLQADALYAQARQQLAANTQQFALATAATKLFQSFNGFPVFYSPANTLAPYLQQRGVWISSFAYPTPTDAPITRVVLSALHTADDVALVAGLVQAFAAE
ncbi:aminotransferase class I/II-fold pyridoxal phosphate-dependent enzyme [Hymenobacter puniceus]|uniref:aminotransferase class I/II-fold pyridoxal phosphate-dependent enzyme n=1 Tax=Hymenobacter sp. BT190 TaxID=2763505 RepID=UPI001650F711|nr:aminotransferase class I/II-fold pyridoxal phosphate-dependent enzyme [Hymenobacter sp. BT190]MBC6700014.1 pyridoxal phosphate-dependent aminotransferase family protein [Hymenobacter sp. BT190]